VTAGSEMLTLTFMASLASPNKSSMESMMLWSWTSVSLMSFMEVSTPELSMMGGPAEEKDGYAMCYHKQKFRPELPHEGVNITIRCIVVRRAAALLARPRDDPAQGPHAGTKSRGCG
jgi:hypothetical protein